MTAPHARWTAWIVFTVIWTAGLTTPITGPSFGDTEEMRNFTRNVFAKGAHLFVYAAWAYFTGWLRTPLRIRLFLLIFLMFHAVGTEWIQERIPRRSGSLRDAAIDHLGIFLGVCASLKWWTATDSTQGDTGT